MTGTAPRGAPGARPALARTPRSVAEFVRTRRAGWERLEALGARAAAGRLPLAEVEELDRLYRRAAADLARARVAFPGSDAEGYLAQVVAGAYATLYRPRRAGPAAWLRFYRDEVPAAFRAHAGAFALAVALLGAGVLGGALAVAWEPSAADMLVPEPVRDAIRARRMWTDDLLTAAPGVWGSAILRNNVAVAALAFALGLTAGVGTGLLLLANGLLLGAVAVEAVRGGLGGPFFSFVAAHGPAELLALLLAAQGGFVLAGALVDPGEWPRGAALAARARAGARLLAAAVPALALVALLEAAVSPGERFPPGAKLALGLGLAGGLLAWLARAGRGEAPGEGPDEAGAPRT